MVSVNHDCRIMLCCLGTTVMHPARDTIIQSLTIDSDAGPDS